MERRHVIGAMSGNQHYTFIVITPEEIEGNMVYQKIAQKMNKVLNPDWDGSMESAVDAACKENNWLCKKTAIRTIPEGFF